MGRHSVSHANPQAGKNAMIVGTLEKIAGAGLVVFGVWTYIDSRDSSGMESMKILSGLGGCCYVLGWVTKKFGRLQHWYSNKTYDD
jgi:hypothetical protein